MADGIKKISENVTVDKRALVITDPNVPDNDAIIIGALQSDPAKKGLRIKTAKNVYSLFDAANFIMPGSIVTNLLADGCVTTIKLADRAVTEPKIADDAISTRTIINSAVITDKLANNAVTESKIADNAIVNRHYHNDSISNNKIMDNTIQNEKLFNKTITNKKIADGTIIESLLANGCIVNRHLSNGCITNNNFTSQCIYGDAIKIKGVEQRHLANNAVNTINILNGAVTGDKLADNCISQRHLTINAVTTVNIEDHAITNNKLADLSVGTTKIINKSITKEKLGDDVIGLIGDPVQYDQDNNVTLRKNLSVNGNIEAKGDISGARVFNAVFMDLAEAYIPGEKLEQGDIVEIRENGKVYKSTFLSHKVVGVVSDQYATCFGATPEELRDGKKVAVGLIGKVPVKVFGSVEIGDKIAIDEDGLGMKCIGNVDTIIGKALETNLDTGVKKVLCLIYPN